MLLTRLAIPPGEMTTLRTAGLRIANSFRVMEDCMALHGVCANSFYAHEHQSYQIKRGGWRYPYGTGILVHSCD